MTSRTIPPAVRALAPAAALALLLSGCGLLRAEEPASTETEEGASEETEAPDTEEGGPSRERSTGSNSLADPGILTAACQPESGWLEFTLHSAEDAQEITSVRFDTAEAVHAESDDLTHGRAVDARSVSLETSCDTGAPSLFPERGLVLGTFEERVDGVAVTGFGVMAEDGTFTALSPDHEESGADAPADHVHPVADPEGDRIVFVTETGEGEDTVQALDLESGEFTDLGTCDSQQVCENLTIMPGLDRVAIDDGQSTPMAVVLDGSTVVQSNDLGLSFFDIGDQADSDVVDLTLNFLNRDRTTEVDVDASGTVQALDSNTLLFDDEVLSVLEFSDSTLAGYEEENATTPRNLWEPLPVNRTLAPDGDGENSHVVLSPDGAEILFRNQPQSGPASWYRVPTDGSGAPEELPGMPGNVSTVIGWR
ncbi:MULTISPECIES: hypothetical protein [unclassified Nocardiopsis]|uniref:hypothetical protein n=1 Tax=unclassified Nocardiopsis TaxID=2649073 RepID=UPI00066DBD3B|nr:MULTISPECIES: hypothetical protein [unclassified Nocardiopsis]MBQ1084213.1 hypothetical protein [Nocardiopsis sp. B62]